MNNRIKTVALSLIATGFISAPVASQTCPVTVVADWDYDAPVPDDLAEFWLNYETSASGVLGPQGRVVIDKDDRAAEFNIDFSCSDATYLINASLQSIDSTGGVTMTTPTVTREWVITQTPDPVEGSMILRLDVECDGCEPIN